MIIGALPATSHTFLREESAAGLPLGLPSIGRRQSVLKERLRWEPGLFASSTTSLARPLSCLQDDSAMFLLLTQGKSTFSLYSALSNDEAAWDSEKEVGVDRSTTSWSILYTSVGMEWSQAYSSYQRRAVMDFLLVHHFWFVSQLRIYLK